MSQKLEEFVRQSIDTLLAKLPPEELRKRLSTEKRLEGLSPDELLEALPPETLEAPRARLKANGPSSRPE